MTRALTITAKHWQGGWELWHGQEPWTQVRTLEKAHQQVIDYLDTIDETVDHSSWDIRIVPEIAHQREVQQASQAARAAQEAQEQASRASRQAVRTLKAEGLSHTDIGYLLGVTRARVSQLAQDTAA
ncbi:antitoxin HicB [Arcanobacterium canis]|uniref:Antitoxin HicB n=1 Tax=Arcanobacterium canis TaxID=999183 RepID=A0ABY8FXU3_9ACTO|nr:antitoxin HicB [Arcanobacterium canis]WFM83332.1 antitoxin HicB [Arcanobacterium canis]